jgi:uroporphyrinogen decarboxylase
MTEITPLQRVNQLLAFEEPDRIACADAYWEDTLVRWRQEGLPPDTAPSDYFGFDFDWIYMDASLRLPEKLLEETAAYSVRQDKHGFVAKQWKGRAGAIGYLQQAVNNRHDWDLLKERLVVDEQGPSRIHTVSYFEPFVTYPSWQEMADTFGKLRDRQRYILLAVYGPHEANWRKHGFEQTLMDMIVDPGLLEDMSRAHVDLVIQSLEIARAYGIQPDGLFMVEDLGMNTGLQFSPKSYESVLFSHHRRLGDYLRLHGIHYFIHTDGDIRRLIPRLIDAGIQVLQPLEARAGLDVRRLKAEYGRTLAYMGNINVEKMSASAAELEEEVRSKLAVVMPGGGYLYHSDHSVPPTVSFDAYQHLMALLRQYGAYA